jgi:hypothetical protein
MSEIIRDPERTPGRDYDAYPEQPAEVFRALWSTLPDDEKQHWLARWEAATRHEDGLREQGRRWDESLVGTTRFGQ